MENALSYLHIVDNVVQLRSKGPDRKGSLPIKEIISGSINPLPIHFYIGYEGFSVYRSNWAGPTKSLGANFPYNERTNNDIDTDVDVQRSPPIVDSKGTTNIVY